MKNKSVFGISLIIFLIMTVFLSACKKGNDLPDNVPVALSCTDINSSITWADRGDGVDYILDCVISVNAKLTIAPGVIIRCNSNSGIVIETSGSLVVAGTAAMPIELKGETDIAGIWKGVYIKSGSVLNETVTNGGGTSFDGNGLKLAIIRLSLSAKLKLSNSIVSKSYKDGLLVDGLDADSESPVTQFSNNTFTENQNYPISALAALGNVLDGTGSTYSGNTNNKILFRGGRLFGGHIWKKMSVPYLIQDVVSVGYDTQDGNLTISPGVTAQFAADTGLCTGDYASGSWIRIIGSSPPNVVKLTGETATTGSWKGIAFQSTSPNNQISYAEISYGSSSSYTGNPAQKGNVIAGAWSAGSFVMDNTNVLNSVASGVYATLPSPAITIDGSNYLSGNTSGTYYHE